MADIRTLDLNLLKALDALLDERSVTRAAARLSLTQPSVSGMLTRLREAFGDPLFVRTQRGIVPTARALELAAPVKRVLCEVDVLLKPPVFDPGTADFTLSVASTDYALGAFVLPFLTRLHAAAPGVRVVIRPLERRLVYDELRQGALDIALLTPETTPDDLNSVPLCFEDYVCAMRADHPAAAPGALTLEAFCALDHALVSFGGSPFHGATDEALAALGRTRRVTVSLGSFLAVPGLLRASDLISVVPRRLVEGMAGLALRAPPVEVAGFTETLVWHERTHHDAGKHWARTLMIRTHAPGRERLSPDRAAPAAVS
ncbi:transcriptional regulator [Azorhizobium oxalatiphilum]|uniref:Transcriptional regulator n=1 Tax=Azorhizobium oxalatiphilum TaxID=980631 RepID=A0A917C510_9HYPH|nr:LysR family transcriptional regulator [Azorhizobium oxalatiphilum]GGF72467.1 transcriptional regulator [Azorhizobium oxalatiphilum]